MSATRATILLVDDAPENIDVLRGVLGDKYDFRPAINGQLALRLALVEPMPDLILLDVMMPGIDGYEVCRQLKADPRTRNIPVIFITAKSETGDEVQGLSLGAVDYLSKPVVPAIVEARVNTHLALRRASVELEAKNLALQQVQRELEEKKLTLEEEKGWLEDIVMRMRSSNPFDGRHLRHIQKSLERTAGDIALSAYRPDGTQHVLVGDFSGHGLPAAFGGPLVSYIFYHLSELGHSLQSILVEINRVIYRQLPTQLYMAASCLEIAAARNTLKVWNYGLPPVLCLDGTGEILRVRSSGLPLGVAESVESFEPHLHIEVPQAMRIYQYSDGLTEAMSPAQQQFGQAALEQLLQRIYREQLSLEEVWQALERHCADAGLSDDAVLLETSVA